MVCLHAFYWSSYQHDITFVNRPYQKLALWLGPSSFLNLLFSVNNFFDNPLQVLPHFLSDLVKTALILWQMSVQISLAASFYIVRTSLWFEMGIQSWACCPRYWSVALGLWRMMAVRFQDDIEDLTCHLGVSCTWLWPRHWTKPKGRSFAPWQDLRICYSLCKLDIYSQLFCWCSFFSSFSMVNWS